MVEIIDEIFTRFDALAEHHRVEKIKTIGDAYIGVDGKAGAIHVAESTRRALDGRFHFDDRGVIDIKGKGPMQTFLLLEAPERA